MEINDATNFEMNENELLKMLNIEIETNKLYHNNLKEIKNILVEESELYERIRKIQNSIMTLQYSLGENSS